MNEIVVVYCAWERLDKVCVGEGFHVLKAKALTAGCCEL